MKKLSIILSLVAVALAVHAASPFYKTLSGNGNATTPAEVDFVSDPYLQLRLVTVNYNSDTNNAVLSLSSGSTAYAITATNALSSSVTNLISSTNNLAVGSVLWLEHLGSPYIATVSSWNSSTNYIAATSTNAASGGTNVVLNSGGFGVVTSIGDTVYLMTTPATLPIGAATNALNGDALFVAQPGRPMRVQLTPALATNRINAATCRQE